MARKQLQIAGTERTDIPPEILEAGEKWLDLRTQKRRLIERSKEAKFGLIALMESRKVETFRYKDPETGETRALRLRNDPTISVVKVTDEGEEDDRKPADVGGTPGLSTPGVHPALIEQAEKAQATEANVTVSEEGDVEVPDTAAPREKRGKKAAK